MSSGPPPSSYLAPRRRTSLLTKPRPVTSTDTAYAEIPPTPTYRQSFRASYHGSIHHDLLDWQSFFGHQDQQRPVFEEDPLFPDPYAHFATKHDGFPYRQHARRSSSLAESLRSGVSSVRSLGRRVSLSIRGKNKGTSQENTFLQPPPQQLHTRRSSGNLLDLSQAMAASPRPRPKSRASTLLNSLSTRRRPSMPMLNLAYSADQHKPDSIEIRRPSSQRPVTILPDYVFGGAGARAAAAAQNEALQLARNTPLPPYDPGTTSQSKLRDSESGIGIVLDGLERQDSRTIHVVRRDPANVLVTELLEHILSFLDAASLMELELVSKKWKELCSSQAVWRQVFFREYAPSRPSRLIPGPPTPGLGKNIAGQNFRKLYTVRKLIEKRWANGEAAAIYLNGHKDSVYCVQFDEEKIITGSRDNTIRVWDARTYQCIRKLAPSNNSRERNQLLRPDVEPHGVVPFFKMDASSMEPRTPYLPIWHQASVLCLQYDDDILVTGSSDFTCIVWDIKNDYQPIFRLVGHMAGVLDVCIDRKRIVTCSKDTTIKIWDRQTGILLKTLVGHRGPVNAVQVRGNLLASASGDGMSKLWRLDDGMCIKEFHSKERGLACVEFSEDGRTIFAGGNDHVIYEYDTTTGNIRRELQGHRDLVRSLHLDSSNGRIISGSYDHSIRVWDAFKGLNPDDGGLKLNLEGWTSSWMLAAKSNYRKIACASQDGRVVIVDFGFGINGVELVEA